MSIYLINPCGFTPCDPSVPGIRLGGPVPPPSLTIPVIRLIPFTDDDFGDFRRLGPRMDSSGPFPVTKTFIGPISTHDTAAGAPAISTTCTVDAGDPPGLAFALPVVSPPSTIGTTVPVPPDLISSRTRHLAAAAARTPRATADYGLSLIHI